MITQSSTLVLLLAGLSVTLIAICKQTFSLAELIGVTVLPICFGVYLVMGWPVPVPDGDRQAHLATALFAISGGLLLIVRTATGRLVTQ